MAHIPGGSGNGVAHSCGLKDFTTAAFSICKGHTSPMDVASVLQAPGRRMYILLSMVYGLLANVDVDTEHLRWMGDVRFTLGSIKVSRVERDLLAAPQCTSNVAQPIVQRVVKYSCRSHCIAIALEAAPS